MIAWTMRRACRRFGGTDGTFNAAGFSQAWSDVTGIRGGLGGETVAAMLHGRNDVVVLRGGAHYRLAPTAPGRGETDE